VTAARRQFGEHGYERTTIRSVASEAGVDPGLVMHFFGTKQRLFGEAVEVPFDPAIVVAGIGEGPLAEQGTRLARFVVSLLGDPVYGKAFTGLVRAAVSDPLAAELLRDRLTHDALIPLARALSVDQPELRAALAATQTIGLVVGYTILKLEALAAVPDDQLVLLIAPALQHYLAEPL
jgi:AcrR family transcriptional regulator